MSKNVRCGVLNALVGHPGRIQEAFAEHFGVAKYIKPYLLRGLKVDHRNQVWSIGITYIPTKKGFMYLTAIIDVYSRFILGWSLQLA